MTLLYQVITVFFTIMLVDFAWSMYIIKLGERKTLAAASWSAFITLAGGIATIGYIGNHWLLIPAVAGGFVGTYVSKYFIKEKKK